MYIQSLDAVVQDGTVSFDVAEKYLSLYIGDSNWKEKIGQLWSVQKKKLKDDSLAKDFVKKSIACACLSPIINKVAIPDEKHVLIFWVSGWPQFNERDWFSLFQEVIKKDIEIEKNRRKIFQLGIFEQIDMSPLTRQAYNWIYDRLEKESFDSEDKRNEAIEKIKNLVKIYGGAIICNLFTNYSPHVDKILNWRSGYFIEREIYKVYSLDQIVKIKSAEINKTNKNYIKTIK
jgi:hypothetical protein